MPAPGRFPFYEQLYNHIALPRDVPGREDGNLPTLEAAVLTRLIDATRILSSHVTPSHQQQMYALGDSLNTCQSLHVNRTITKSALLQELRSLQTGRMLILHISTQNCGLLIYNHYT